MAAHLRLLFPGWVLMALATLAQARTCYVDARHGDDTFDGSTPQTAWRSLEKASSAAYQPGDQLLLHRGDRFAGSLKLTIQGQPDQPILIGAFGSGPAPIIDAAGHYAGVQLIACRYVEVRDLEITADGGIVPNPAEKHKRFGVLVDAGDQSTSHVTLTGLTIHHIFPEIGTKNEGRNPTSYLGTAIEIRGNEAIRSSGFLVKDCRIFMTGFKAISLSRVSDIRVIDNQMKDIGGPAIQPGRVEDLLVRGNTVDGSGSDKDPRMHMRGSGIWPWTSRRVLIEHNRFMHARGKGDSCGIHIDFNCSDVVVQYNLSIDNEGGFIEILGNNRNCAYRYNISVNDGSRVKGKNGAHQSGKILWTSGYAGKGHKAGPFNSYIYNNTIYVPADAVGRMALARSTEGLLIANNIFCILGKTQTVGGDQESRLEPAATQIPRSLMTHNLFLSDAALPPNFPLHDQEPIVGDPRFAHPGGTEPADYLPRHTALVRNRGIVIQPLPGDDIGLRLGLQVQTDILGRPITDQPDLGAIELP